MSLTLSRRGKLLTLVAATAMAVAGLGLAQAATGVRYDRVPKAAYAVVAEVRAKPGKAEELRKATLPLVAEVRREPNNVLYFLHEDREAPGHFVFYEVFANRADFDAHNDTAYVKQWLARLPDLAEGGVKVMHLKVLVHGRQ